jgi:hypothetical protein
MTSQPRAHLPPRLLPVLYFGTAHVALAFAFAAVAIDPRRVSGFFYHARMLGSVVAVSGARPRRHRARAYDRPAARLARK